MTAPEHESPPRLDLPTVLRRAAGHLAEGPHRDALVELANELDAGGDPAPIAHETIWSALKAIGSPNLLPDAGVRLRASDADVSDEPPEHVRRVAFLRREADRHPDDSAREALLRYADELEEKRESQFVSQATLLAGLKALDSLDAIEDDDYPVCTCRAAPQFDEPPEHVRRAAFVRREADHHPDGPARDALLRYADELEEKRESQFVSQATLLAGLKAFDSPDRLPDADGAFGP